MLTVHEVSDLTGVTDRALHHYDAIGLLHHSQVSKAGYRLYDDTALSRLSEIMLLKELEFPLREIQTIPDRAVSDRDMVLEQQIRMLELKRDRLNDIICLARKIRTIGVDQVDLKALDTRKLDTWREQARKEWGSTEAWKEYETKSEGRSREKEQRLDLEMAEIFRRFGGIRDSRPDSDTAEALVRELQAYITKNYYTCTDEILRSLALMYAAGGEMTENIDSFGGKGTAVFVSKAVRCTLGDNGSR